MLDRPALRVYVEDDLLVVTEPLTHFYAIYSKHPELPQLILKRRRQGIWGLLPFPSPWKILASEGDCAKVG